MENEFVPYEIALRMKELGYNERNIYHYANGILQEGVTYNSDDEHRDYESISAPLYQQCFRWFRQKYGLSHIWIMAELLDTGEYTYGEAELECLKNLIEIVKEQK
jgi:hypothetical protein